MTRGLYVDLFAGGGGTSLGLEWAFGFSPDIAINHDREAIAMHAANHPHTLHYTEDVRKVDIRKVVAGRPVDFLWLSPDCKHHSKAKGGKPVDRKIRGLAWEAIRWAEQAGPWVICLENVQEFRDWGPLGKDGRPQKSQKGYTYNRFKARLKKLGYEVEDRLLRACDYGAPTTRERLFLIARRDGQPIVWPRPTHSKNGAGGLQPWRTAAECIDFSLPCPSIFLTPEEAKPLRVRRPLAEKTERRIARGIDRFVIHSPRPFIVNMAYGEVAPDGLTRRRGHGQHDLGGPLPTITGSGGGGFGLAAPTIVPVNHAGDLRTHSVEEPLRTITGAHRGEHALVGAFLAPRYGERDGQEPRALPIDQPAPTIVPTQNGGSLVTAFLAKHYGCHETPGSQLGLPIDTITATDHNALVASSLVKLKGSCNHGQAADEPLHTIQAGGYHYAEVRAFLTRYNGASIGQQLDLPASTIDATDRLGLAQLAGECGDIGSYRNPSCLWKRMGVAVINGGRQRRISGDEALVHGYSPVRRSILFNIGDALLKQNREGEWRALYLQRKAFEFDKASCQVCTSAHCAKEFPNGGCTPGHLHNRARRYMEKRLLKKLWAAWRAAARAGAGASQEPAA